MFEFIVVIAVGAVIGVVARVIYDARKKHTTGNTKTKDKPKFWYYHGMFGDVHAIRKNSFDDKCIKVLSFFAGVLFVIILSPVIFWGVTIPFAITCSLLNVPTEIGAVVLVLLLITAFVSVFLFFWKMYSPPSDEQINSFNEQVDSFSESSESEWSSVSESYLGVSITIHR